MSLYLVLELNWNVESVHTEVRYIRDKMKKCNILLTRACNFIGGEPQLKLSAQLIPRIMAINAKYIQRLKTFERSTTGEKASVVNH